jgi:trehalose 6-phosphate phosphatase
MSWPSRRLARLIEQIARRPRVLFLLDFDGTLCEIAPSPGKVRLSKTRRGVLSGLAAGRGRMALLSGRSAADLKSRVGLRKMIYGGCFGLEISGPSLNFVHPRARAVRPKLSALKAALSRSLRGVDGVLIEDKGATLAVHERGVAPARRRLLREILKRLCARARGLKWKKGKLAWEILPDVSWDKGAAAMMIWRRLNRSYLVVIGDDHWDEPMFKAARGRGAALRVGGRPRGSHAGYRLRNVDEVYAFLRALNGLKPI